MDWMTPQIHTLAWTAMAIGLIHTLLGPDHYLPFVALSRARRWSLARTLGITAICGVGHVMGSVAIGLSGLAVGAALNQLVAVESLRGELASWGLLSFGLVYTAWGVKQSARNRVHRHAHVHADGTAHLHDHNHHREHAHPHTAGRHGLRPWAMFILFVLGPCEALIPVLMYPAAANNYPGLAWVVTVFGATTIVTMTAIVALAVTGMARLGQHRWERHAHTLAGVAISACGLSMLLGL